MRSSGITSVKNQPLSVFSAPWRMSAALQICLGKSDVIEPLKYGIHVIRLAVMRSASQSQVPVPKIKRIGCTAFDQKKRLQWFDCGAGINQSLNITHQRNRLSVASHHR